jgi:hypothetical protein
MTLIDRALEARSCGHHEDSISLFRDALGPEKNAAILTKQQPSRSILFRSAANIAIECGSLDDAEQLACLGLIGNPPDDIADELRSTLDRATFARHLRLQGVTLSPTSIQLAIAGPSVGHGDAPEAEIMSRVDAYRKMIARSANRMRGQTFTENPPTNSMLPDFQLYMSNPRAASFAVTLRVGSRQSQQHFRFDVSPEQVIDDVLSNLGHFEENRQDELAEAIAEVDYRRNFIALARKMAPDGVRITTVGLTRATDNRVKTLALRQPRANHQTPRGKSSLAPTVTLEGRLEMADTRGKSKSGRIILSSDNGSHNIAVPKGMLADIVRPHFTEHVAIRARKRQNGVYEFVDFV